ncbi:MAG: rod shape-determining protein MreC, partial [Pseudomonadota bacterium]
TLAFFLLFVPSLFFYALQNKSSEYATGTVFQTPAHWLQKTYDLVTHQIQDSLNTYLYLVGVNDLNKTLKIENAKMASKVLLLEEYRSENIRLRELYKFKQELARKTIAARVISKDILDDRKSFVIDKGLADGVKRLQGVIAAEGAVGYTIEVEHHTSRILLLSNKNASVDAIVQRTRARGIVSGDTNRKYRLKHMMREEDAKPGDLIVTSGRKGFFPKGFSIGEVISVSSSATGVSFGASVRPTVKIDRLEQVLVLVERQNQPEKEAKKL